MHRIAFRSFHAPSKIHRQAWAITATRATWHPQRQPFEYCRRQFHVSLPKQSTPPTPVELVESIQSIPPIYFALPVLAFLPHLLRYAFQTRAKRKASERFSAAVPLEIVHSAVLNRRVRAMAKDTTLIRISQEQAQQIGKLDRDFQIKLNNKYAPPYSTWERQTLIPPALHVAWTTFTVLLLGPGADFSQSVDTNGLPNLLTGDTTVDTMIHALGCAVLVGAFHGYFKENMFWQSFPSHYVDQMRPWLKNLYGLNTVVPGKTPGTVMPYWFSQLKDDSPSISDLLERSKNDSGGLDPKALIGQASVSPDNTIAFAIVLALAAPVLWSLSLIQGLYLFTTFFASVIRLDAIKSYEKRLNKEIFRRRSKWVPLNPVFPDVFK